MVAVKETVFSLSIYFVCLMLLFFFTIKRVSDRSSIVMQAPNQKKNFIPFLQDSLLALTRWPKIPSTWATGLIVSRIEFNFFPWSSPFNFWENLLPGYCFRDENFYVHRVILPECERPQSPPNKPCNSSCQKLLFVLVLHVRKYHRKVERLLARKEF